MARRFETGRATGLVLASAALVADHELLASWTAGDNEAGNALFLRHFDAIFGFFHTRAQTHAEELTQRSFLTAVEVRDRFRQESSFRAFLFGIARKHLLKFFDEQRKQANVTFRTVSLAELGVSLASRLATQQQEQRLLDAMARLPVDLQIALDLHYWEGLTTRELGEILGCPQGTAKRWLWRARQLLAADLGVDPDALELGERPG